MKKKNLLKACGALCLALLMCVALVGCGSTSNSDTSSAGSDSSYTLLEDGTLTVMSDLAFPPFDYMDGDTPTGFDVDVMTEVANRLGLKVKYLDPQAFDTVIPSIAQGGKADVACAAITITDERQEQVDLSDPYIDSNLGIVVKSGATAKTSEDLNKEGMKVVVLSGSSSEDWAKENLSKATISTADPVEGIAGVQQGLYDAMVCDLPVGQYLVSSSYQDCEVSEEIPTGEQYGIAVSKDNPGLLKAINKALAEMQDDGTMDTIEKKWFGEAL